MRRVKIFTNSCCDLSPALAEKLGVPIAFAEGEGADFVAKVFGVEPFA